MNDAKNISIIIPAYNENASIEETIRSLKDVFEKYNVIYEIIVIDDGSVDGTAEKARGMEVKTIVHPCNIGYGNAIKTGVVNAKYDIIAIADADGTYPLSELPTMMFKLIDDDYDMIVASRTGKFYYGSLIKRLARTFFKVLCEFTTGKNIPDINSGMRIIRKSLLVDFWNMLCGGFSFTTTITLVSTLAGRFVSYYPVQYFKRSGESKIKFRRDVLQALQIIIMTIIVYNPIKLFLAVFLVVFFVGFIALLTTILLPSSNVKVLLASIYFLMGVFVLSLGFLAEQRRALPPNKVLDKKDFNDAKNEKAPR